MNTIKFSERNIAATEQSNMELMQSETVQLFGQKYNLKIPCNLNIFITNECNNRCSFCINNQKYEGKMCKVCTKSDCTSCSTCEYNKNYLSDSCDGPGMEEYLEKLEEVFSEFKKAQAHIEITITGGEPTLETERLVKVMRLCRKYGFPCRTFSTTGKGLFDTYEGIPLYRHMVDNGFVHNISISRMSVSDTENDKIMQGKNITNDEIEKLTAFFKYNGAEMRISCNLLPDGVHTKEQMLTFEEFFRRSGVESVLFREVIVPVDSKQKYPEIAEILNKNNMPEEFSYIETTHSNVYDVDIYSYRNMIVKYYTHNDLDRNSDEIQSLSFNNGILRIGFSGKQVN